MDIEQILQNMTLEEKIALCSGADFWHTKEMKQHEILSIMMSDGPHGLRKQPETADMLGINEAVAATSFPTAVLSACSWDKELLKREGEAIAREAIANKVSVVLGPGANIKRNPLCGRNFEYFSEDPYISGMMAAAIVNAIQSVGIGACIKHFACNNKEDNRYHSDSIVSERALREIYLKGFEIAIEESNPWSIMTSYNKINGKYSPENEELVNGILREEWGYDGVAIADWGSLAEPYREILAGNNVHMPVSNCLHLCIALEKGLITKEQLRKNAKYVLNFILKLK